MESKSLPPRQNLEEYRGEGYPEGLQPIVDAILDIYKRLENTHELASEARYPPRY